MKAAMVSDPARTHRLEGLRATLRALDGSRARFERDRIGFGSAALDALLPWQGIPLASLCEIAGPARRGFAAALAGRILDHPGTLVWCTDDRHERLCGRLYGPGLARYGIDTRRLVLVRAPGRREVLQVAEEALRCPAVVCTLAETGSVDFPTSRRLLLAAEQGGGIGLLLAATVPDLRASAALIRFHVAHALAGREPVWRLDARRVRGGAPWTCEVRFDEATLSFAVAAGLPDRAGASGGAAPRPLLPGRDGAARPLAPAG